MNDKPANSAGRSPVIYVLHFDGPREHAQHYIGVTGHLEGRMTAHANGTGARLTEVLKELGEHWKVAALYSVKPTATRTPQQIERDIKRANNGPRFCPICTRSNAIPKGTLAIPVPELTSQQLRKESEPCQTCTLKTNADSV
jgi:predicted GIY-YIG superfamily endonuclease